VPEPLIELGTGKMKWDCNGINRGVSAKTGTYPHYSRGIIKILEGSNLSVKIAGKWAKDDYYHSSGMADGGAVT
jgi:hypothetical protein